MEKEFKPFKIKCSPKLRYWEDDSTGVLVKRGGPEVEIHERQARSYDLRFALLRNYVLITEGECVFVFKDEVLKVIPGKTKNLIVVIKDKKGNDVEEVLVDDSHYSEEETKEDVPSEEKSEPESEDINDYITSSDEKTAISMEEDGEINDTKKTGNENRSSGNKDGSSRDRYKGNPFSA